MKAASLGLALFAVVLAMTSYGAEERGKEYTGTDGKKRYTPDWRRVNGTNYNVSVLREWDINFRRGTRPLPGWMAIENQGKIVENHKLGEIRNCWVKDALIRPKTVSKPVTILIRNPPRMKSDIGGKYIAMFCGTLLWRGQQIPVYDCGEFISEAEALRIQEKPEKPAVNDSRSTPK